ncbi:hypothetical protein H2198_003397 [Neophaeococcomyces mojaviensis]|uniref:Uncharacterized protein n=1 Tax=Neophaeococcomyces mojaviensis TaxID=3383035 RepID=A0ACC3ABK7_9EURO|nr:hypothetical protein H2198_003397 [Knufia sp. JES_112]
MAEEERQWLQRHTHESNTLSYGHFGTAAYDRQDQIWSFLRRGDHGRTKGNDEINGEDNRNTGQSVRLLDVAETVIEAIRADTDSAKSSLRAAIKLVKPIPEFAAASFILRHAVREDQAHSLDAPSSQLLDFGSAVWLGAGGVDSGNLKLPIYVVATGPSANVLHLAILRRQSLDHEDDDGIFLKLSIPSVPSNSDATWAGTESILQAVFSPLDQKGNGNTFLAVRQASRTSIFQPLIPRNSFFDSEFSTIALNLLVPIDTAATGGHFHADVAFHPHNQRNIAIIDVQGNWSTWNVKGRRSHTARVLHQAHLKTFGKIFSWTHRRRPDAVAPYFDGWHKVLWLSGNSRDISRLLICNRQAAKLFDLKGNEVCSIDIRLDIQKESSYILDVKPGPEINLCFVLTTSKLLLFDLAQNEWRDAGQKKGPALLCAWQHFYSSTDRSLRIATATRGVDTLVALYSSSILLLRLYQLRLIKVNGKQSVVSSDPTTIKLANLPASSFSNVSLTLVDVSSRQNTTTLHLPKLLRITVLHENLAVSTVLAEWLLPALGRPDSIHSRPFLRLPPERGTRSKSERRVDELDDEDDLTGFVIPDSPNLQPSVLFQTLNRDTGQPFRPVLSSKQMSKILDHLHVSENKTSASEKHHLIQALQGLAEAFQNSDAANHLSAAITVFEFLTGIPKVEDIEAVSVGFNQTLESLKSQFAAYIHVSDVHELSDQLLVQTYEQIFDFYVSSLTQNIPDRVRVHHERLAREIALDLHLSSHTIRRQTPYTDPSVNLGYQSQAQVESQDIPSSDAIILSDPIQPVHAHSVIHQVSSIAQISASQPQPSAFISERTHTLPSLQAPLEIAISRLSALTTISKPPAAIQSVKDHIPGMLAHLPEAVDVDPESYDWAAAEMVPASGGVLDPSAAATRDSKARRKAERLSKARKRAGNVQDHLAENKDRKSIVPTVASTQPQVQLQSTRAENDFGVAGMGMLPIRSSSTIPPQLPQLPGLPTIEPSRSAQGTSQPHGLILSDPNEGQPESSSQAMGGITLTQPERGVFGTRTSKDKGRGGEKDRGKKKRRIAGF